MPVSKAQQKAVNGYISRSYDRINLTVPKGRQADIKKRADSIGESVNGYINKLIQADMEADDASWKRQPDSCLVNGPAQD